MNEMPDEAAPRPVVRLEPEDGSAAKEALGCLGMLLGSVFLFIAGFVGFGLNVWGVVVGNPYLTGFGLGLWNTGFAIGLFGFGISGPHIRALQGGGTSDMLFGLVPARWLYVISTGFAMGMAITLLIVFDAEWRVWLTALPLPSLLLVVFLAWIVRRPYDIGADMV